MLSFLRIPEAVQVLKKETNREWTASEILDVARQRNIKLHAAAPAMAAVEVLSVKPGEGFGDRQSLGSSYAPLAWLYPNDIGQLLISNEALTSQPYITSPMVGERYRYTEPVRVTVDTVRIQPETLSQIIAIWKEAQSGPWVEVDDGKEPPGKMKVMRWGPNWMFPQQEYSVTRGPESKQKMSSERILERKQEAWILIWLRKNKHKPKALPNHLDEERPGLKSLAKKAAADVKDEQDANLFGVFKKKKLVEFEKAWERLSGGLINPHDDSVTGSRHKKRVIRMARR